MRSTIVPRTPTIVPTPNDADATIVAETVTFYRCCSPLNYQEGSYLLIVFFLIFTSGNYG